MEVTVEHHRQHAQLAPAQRPQRADLARALEHAHHHRVHHADSPHENGQRADRPHHRVHGLHIRQSLDELAGGGDFHLRNVGIDLPGNRFLAGPGRPADLQSAAALRHPGGGTGVPGALWATLPGIFGASAALLLDFIGDGR